MVDGRLEGSIGNTFSSLKRPNKHLADPQARHPWIQTDIQCGTSYTRTCLGILTPFFPLQALRTVPVSDSARRNDLPCRLRC